MIRQLVRQLRHFVAWLNWKLYRNKVAMKVNFLYSIYHSLCRITYRLTGERRLTSDSDESRRFSKSGYLKLTPFLSQELLEKVATRADELLADETKVINRGNDGLIRLRGSLDEFQELIDFINPEVVSIIETYYKSHFKIFSTDIYRTIPADTSDRDSFLWHFDNSPQKLVKLMIYLDEVRDETGAFRLKPKAVSSDLKRGGYWDRNNAQRFASELGDASTTSVFEGSLGTAILFQGINCVHKASHPSAGHRDVATFLIHPSLIPWDRHLQRNRARLSRNFGYCVNPFTDQPLRAGDE